MQSNKAVKVGSRFTSPFVGIPKFSLNTFKLLSKMNMKIREMMKDKHLHEKIKTE